MKEAIAGFLVGVSLVGLVASHQIDKMTAFENNEIRMAMEMNAMLEKKVSDYRKMTVIQITEVLHRKGWSESSTLFAADACAMAAFGNKL